VKILSKSNPQILRKFQPEADRHPAADTAKDV